MLFMMLLIFLCFYTPENSSIKQSQLIVILGAGYSQNGTPVLALERRLQKGIEIWNEHRQLFNQKNIYFMISGRKEEVNVMNTFLNEHNIPNEFIIKDIEGYNTWATVENAYYVAQLLETSPIFVSQAYHIPRIYLYTLFYRSSKTQYIVTDRVKISVVNMIITSGRETLAILLIPFLYFTK